MIDLKKNLARHEFRPYAERAKLESELAAAIVDKLSTALALTGKASLAVSGGSTPYGLFEQLSQANIDWPAVDVTLVDERWVETDSDQSNEKMLRQRLIINQAADAHFSGMKSSATNVDQGVTDYNQQLATQIKQPFDVVILGMGPDGHTASWFPDATETPAALDPKGVTDTLATYPASQNIPRITLSFACVARAKSIFLHITGADKRQVLETGLASAREQEKDLPIHQALCQFEQVVDIYWAE